MPLHVCGVTPGHGLTGISRAAVLRPLLERHPRSRALDALEGENATGLVANSS